MEAGSVFLVIGGQENFMPIFPTPQILAPQFLNTQHYRVQMSLLGCPFRVTFGTSFYYNILHYVIEIFIKGSSS